MATHHSTWTACSSPNQLAAIRHESEGDAVTVYHAAGRRPVQVQPVGQSQQHLQGI